MQHQFFGRKFSELVKSLVSERGLIWLLVSLSAVIRTLYLFEVRDNPFLNHPRLDALFHDAWAQSIIQGNVLGDQVFFRAPLYAYALGFSYWIFGHEYLVVRILQHLFGVASVVLVYQLCKKWFNERTSLLAAFFTAVNPMLIYFEGQLLFESFLTTLILVWLLLLTGAIKHQKPKLWFFVGVVLGLLAITRPPILAVGLIVLVITGWRFVGAIQVRSVLRTFFALLLGLVIVILPVTIRNYVVSGEFVLIASQGGVNFFIGNNPDADGISSSMPGRLAGSWENRNETYYIEQAIGHKPTASEESAFWYERAFRFIKTEPQAFFELLVKKFYLFWNHAEIPNNLNFNFFRHYSPLLDYNPFGFWLLGPLALVGMCIAALTPRSYGNTMFLSLVVSYVLVTVAFFVCDRYRAPMIPLFAVLASHGLFTLVDHLRKREYKRFVSFGFLAAICFLFVNSNVYSLPIGSYAREYFTLGVIALDERDNENARDNFRKAYEFEPFYPNLAYNLGVAEWMTGNTALAVNWFHRQLELDPSSFNASINLARIYFGRNSMDSVEHFATAGVQSKPYLPLGYIWLAKAKLAQGQIVAAESILVNGSIMCDKNDFMYGDYLLGGIYSTQGKMGESEIRYRSVLSRLKDLRKARQPLYEPEFAYSNEQKIGEDVNVLQAKSYYGLGQVFLSRGNLDSAATSFSLATHLDPQYADAFVDLGVTLLHLRRFNEAETAVSRGIQLNPNHYLYWFNYGDVLVFQQKYNEAKKAFEKSLSLRPDFLLAKDRLDHLRQMF